MLRKKILSDNERVDTIVCSNIRILLLFLLHHIYVSIFLNIVLFIDRYRFTLQENFLSDSL